MHDCEDMDCSLPRAVMHDCEGMDGSIPRAVMNDCEGMDGSIPRADMPCWSQFQKVGAEMALEWRWDRAG